MELLLTLILAHLFADFPLQTNTIARLKSRYTVGVLLHVIIYVIVTGLLLENALQYLPLLLGLGVVHFLIDVTKLRICKDKTTLQAFLVDQIAHFLSMLIATLLAHIIWQPTPSGTLSTDLLHWSLIAAMVPAGLVYYWVWVTNSQHHSHRPRLAGRSRDQILLFEQRFGLAVVAFVFWVLATKELDLLLQLARQ